MCTRSQQHTHSSNLPPIPQHNPTNQPHSVECLVLERTDFAALLGDLGTILAQETKRREDLVRGAR